MVESNSVFDEEREMLAREWVSAWHHSQPLLDRDCAECFA